MTLLTPPAVGAAGPGYATVVDKLLNKITKWVDVVEDYGADPTGASDSTAVITLAVADAIVAHLDVFFPPGTYKMGAVEVPGASGLTIFGRGATINLTGTGTGTGSTLATAMGFALSGTCTNVTLVGLKIVGSGVATDNHYGMWMMNGGSYVRSGMEHCDVENVTVGAQIYSGLGSDVSIGNFVRHSRFYNIVGDLPGQGYGVVMGYCLFGQVHDNWFERTGRVGVYHGHGYGGDIHDNVFKDHRLVVYSLPHNAPSEAITVARSSHVDVHDNIFTNCFDGCVGLDPSINSEADPKPLEDITVHHNIFWNPHNFAVRVSGVSDPSAVAMQTARGIHIADNLTYIDAPSYGSPHDETKDDTALKDGIFRIGPSVTTTVDRNRFQIFNVTDTVLCIKLDTLGDGSGSETYSDDWRCEDNTFNVVAGGQIVRCVGMTIATVGSIVPVKIKGNSQRGASALTYGFGTITNPNITLEDQPAEGNATLTWGTGVYPKAISHQSAIRLANGAALWGGASGNSGWNGTGAPASTMGANGDWALGVDGHIYAKAAGAWALKV